LPTQCLTQACGNFPSGKAHTVHPMASFRQLDLQLQRIRSEQNLVNRRCANAEHMIQERTRELEARRLELQQTEFTTQQEYSQAFLPHDSSKGGLNLQKSRASVDLERNLMCNDIDAYRCAVVQERNTLKNQWQNVSQCLADADHHLRDAYEVGCKKDACLRYHASHTHAENLRWQAWLKASLLSRTQEVEANLEKLEAQEAEHMHHLANIREEQTTQGGYSSLGRAVMPSLAYHEAEIFQTVSEAKTKQEACMLENAEVDAQKKFHEEVRLEEEAWISHVTPGWRAGRNIVLAQVRGAEAEVKRREEHIENWCAVEQAQLNRHSEERTEEWMAHVWDRVQERIKEEASSLKEESQASKQFAFLDGAIAVCNVREDIQDKCTHSISTIRLQSCQNVLQEDAPNLCKQEEKTDQIYEVARHTLEDDQPFLLVQDMDFEGASPDLHVAKAPAHVSAQQLESTSVCLEVEGPQHLNKLPTTSLHCDRYMADTATCLEHANIVFAEEKRGQLLKLHRKLLDNQHALNSKAALLNATTEQPAGFDPMPMSPGGVDEYHRTMGSANPLRLFHDMAVHEYVDQTQLPESKISETQHHEKSKPSACLSRSTSNSESEPGSASSSMLRAPMKTSEAGTTRRSPYVQTILPKESLSGFQDGEHADIFSECCMVDEIHIPQVYANAIAAVERYGWGVVHYNGPEWTALHWAASEGYVEICKRLLQAAANPFDVDDCGYSALDYARKAGHHATWHMLAQTAGTTHAYAPELL